MPFVTSPDGVRLHYRVVGSGPALVLHVGAGADSGLWRAAGYVKPLSQAYRCILFDHRGHGRSDHPRGPDAYHIDRFRDDVLSLLDALAVERCAFWAYSSGISVGLKVADDAPERLWALVGSGAIGYESSEDIRGFVERRVPELRQHGWERMLERFDVQEVTLVPEWMKSRIRATDVQAFIDSLVSSTTWSWSEWLALARISVPALFLTGEFEDRDDETAGAAARMAHGTRYRVPAKGHIGAFLNSADVLPVALDFLAAHAPTASLSTPS